MASVRMLVPLTGLVVFPWLAAPPASASPHGPMHHHLTLGFGVARYLSDHSSDSDVETGGLGQLAYRYSLNPDWDLCVDGRSVMVSDLVRADDGSGDVTEVEHDTSYFGPGVRWSSGSDAVRPYLQANAFFVTATTRSHFGELTEEHDKDDVGFGLMGGADIRLSRLLSLPLEACFLYGKTVDDVSSLGMSAGLTFNFSPL